MSVDADREEDIVLELSSPGHNAGSFSYYSSWEFVD